MFTVLRNSDGVCLRLSKQSSRKKLWTDTALREFLCPPKCPHCVPECPQSRKSGGVKHVKGRVRNVTLVRDVCAFLVQEREHVAVT